MVRKYKNIQLYTSNGDDSDKGAPNKLFNSICHYFFGG